MKTNGSHNWKLNTTLKLTNIAEWFDLNYAKISWYQLCFFVI